MLKRLFGKPDPDPAKVSREMRDRALSMTPADLGLAPSSARPHVFSAVMETGYEEGVATLVAVADGSVSLYFSKGGGVIGGGAHESVRGAAAAFLDAAEAFLPRFQGANGTPMPSVGQVIFYLRTFEGTLSVESPEEALGEGRHELSPLFYAAHDVITRLREETGDDS